MGQLILFAALVAYGVGAWKFWTGFRNTNFTTGRIVLTAFWPVLFIGNARYRQNFQRALKGN